MLIVMRNDATAEQIENVCQRVRELGIPGRPPAHRPGISGVLRTHGIGAQILKDLGVHRMRVLSSTRRFQAISGFGLEVVEVVAPD